MSSPEALQRLAAWHRLAVVLLLGFTSGLPQDLTDQAMQAWLSMEGLDVATIIGLLSLVGLPYTFKFLWAPLMDRFNLPWLGRRRDWLVLTQRGERGIDGIDDRDQLAFVGDVQRVEPQQLAGRGHLRPHRHRGLVEQQTDAGLARDLGRLNELERRGTALRPRRRCAPPTPTPPCSAPARSGRRSAATCSRTIAVSSNARSKPRTSKRACCALVDADFEPVGGSTRTDRAPLDESAIAGQATAR